MAEELDMKTEDVEEIFGITNQLVSDVLDAVSADDTARIDELLDPLHPADIAHLIEQIGPRDRRHLLDRWHGGIDGEILSELDEHLREEIIAALKPAELIEAMRELDSDDVVDLVEYLDDTQQEVVLRALLPVDRVAVEQALTYPEESAGRHMQQELVRAPEYWTVGDAIDYLRSDVELPDQFYHLILINPRFKAVGYVTLGRILSHPRDTRLKDLQEDTFRTFNVNEDVEDVAQAINHYHMITAPVVDDNDRIVGVITIDDAMRFIDEEAEEDLLRLAGVGEGSLSDRVRDTTRQRAPWLAVNLATAILASLVISLFEDVIAGLVALAVLMPIVASMGGIAGSQTLTLVIRGMAVGQISGANVGWLLNREFVAGVLNGILWAAVVASAASFWFNDVMIGAIIAAALVINLIAAALVGTVLPLFLKSRNIDPALAGSVILTTVTDVVGFMSFLGLATLVYA